MSSFLTKLITNLSLDTKSYLCHMLNSTYSISVQLVSNDLQIQIITLKFCSVFLSIFTTITIIVQKVPHQTPWYVQKLITLSINYSKTTLTYIKLTLYKCE